MYQVPAAVWNRIAQTQAPQNPSMKQLFAMNQEQLQTSLDEQATLLEKEGVNPTVINAYQRMAPLLAENEAISAHINQTENSNLRQALPEVLTAQEAVAIAAQEYPLNDSEQQQLLTLLRPLTPASSTNV